MQQTVGVVAATAALLSGCAVTDGLMSNVSLPASESSNESAAPNAPAASALPAPPGMPQAPPSKLVVTGQQRAYLDALAAAGVHPSSDLLALSIGSYVCQAHAAGQSAQAVWDYVHPLVQSDVRKARLNVKAPTDDDVDAATNSYIRIATERLC